MFNWVDFLTYAVVTAASPGPNTIIAMTNGSKVGVKKALPFNLGVLVGVSVLMVLCTIFCTLLSSVIPKIKLPMLIIGALYMLNMAWQTFRGGAVIQENSTYRGFLSGLFMQFINPKTYLYCILSIEVYILPHFGDSYLSLLGFSLLLAFIGFAFTVLWSAFGSVFKLLFSTHAKITNTVMALLLTYCAVSLFL